MDDFSELEADLRRLRPIEPRAEFLARLERAIESERVSTAGIVRSPQKQTLPWFQILLGCASTLALLVLALRFSNPTPRMQKIASQSPNVVTKVAPSVAPSSSRFEPDGLTQVVYHQRDEGLHFTTAQRPVR